MQDRFKSLVAQHCQSKVTANARSSGSIEHPLHLLITFEAEGHHGDEEANMLRIKSAKHIAWHRARTERITLLDALGITVQSCQKKIN